MTLDSRMAQHYKHSYRFTVHFVSRVTIDSYQKTRYNWVILQCTEQDGILNLRVFLQKTF